MRGSYLNLGKWLTRLGIHDEGADRSPIMARRVMPVAIVADHRDLVSPNIGPSGTVGEAIPASAGNVAALTISARAPMWVRFYFNSNATARVFQMGMAAGVAPLPTVATAVTPQLFDPSQPSSATFRCGVWLVPPVPPAGIPKIRQAFEPATSGWWLVPAGRFISCQNSATNEATEIFAEWRELPIDLGTDG